MPSAQDVRDHCPYDEHRDERKIWEPLVLTLTVVLLFLVDVVDGVN